MRYTIYVMVALASMIPISAYSQSVAEPAPNDDNCLLSEAELWDVDSDFADLDLLWTDADLLCDMFLELCLYLDLADEDIYDIFPELWEPDYEFYLFWENDW